jgi:pimeloyl-ACP methyl ester carboxylesterase
MDHIVLLPGFGCNEWMFSHQIQTLETDFNLKVITPHPLTPLIEHIKHILEISPPEFTLIGHSLGGWFAQWVAIKAPQRIQKLVLMGTCTGKFSGDSARMAEGLSAFFGAEYNQSFFDKFKIPGLPEQMTGPFNWLSLIKDFSHNFQMPDTLQQFKRELEAMNTTQRLAEIACNTLLIHGKQDVFFAREMRILRQHILHNTYIEIDQCGHMLPLEKPELISGLIKTWLLATH